MLALKEQMGGQLEVALLGSYLTPDMYKQISDGCETSGDVDLREVEKLSDAALLELPVAFPKMKRLYTNAQALDAGICQPWIENWRSERNLIHVFAVAFSCVIECIQVVVGLVSLQS